MTTISSTELNYLVWRYLQEEGLALSSLAFDKEVCASSLDEKLGSQIKKRDLVQLVLKGLQLRDLETCSAGKSINPFIKSSEDSQNLPSSAPMDDSNTTVKSIVTSAGRVENAPWLVPKESLEGATAVSFFDEVLAIGTPTEDTRLHQGNATTALKYAKAGKDAHVTSLSWHPSGSILAVGSYAGNIRVWTASGALQHVLTFHRAPVVELRWNPDGTFLAATDCLNCVSLWDTESGELRQEVSSSDLGLLDVVWIDNRTYVVAQQTEIAVRRVSDVIPHVRFRGHTRPISCVSFDAASQLLASGSDDYAVNIWHARSIVPLRTLQQHLAPITNLCWLTSPVNQSLDPTVVSSLLISGSSDNTVICWDINKAQPKWVQKVKGSVLLLALSSDCQLLAVGAEQLEVYKITSESSPVLVGVWSPPAGLQSLSWHDHTLAVATSAMTAVFSI